MIFKNRQVIIFLRTLCELTTHWANCNVRNMRHVRVNSNGIMVFLPTWKKILSLSIHLSIQEKYFFSLYIIDSTANVNITLDLSQDTPLILFFQHHYVIECVSISIAYINRHYAGALGQVPTKKKKSDPTRLRFDVNLAVRVI